MFAPKPDWLKKSTLPSPVGLRTAAVLKAQALASVCESAGCPNRAECYAQRRATFLILGPSCTRRCAFCLVRSGLPAPVDPSEPARVSRAAAALGLRHVVVTSVTRDDLPDGGAGQFSRVIRSLRRLDPAPSVEVLVPDFSGNGNAVREIIRAGAEVVGHNLETVPRLHPAVRPQADYRRSLRLLERVKTLAPETLVKSGLMAGLGETEDEIAGALRDLRRAGCDLVTIGQYLAPSRRHAAVRSYLPPAAFDRLRSIALGLGFRSALAGPFVRSSYHADREYQAAVSRSGRPGANDDL